LKVVLDVRRDAAARGMTVVVRVVGRERHG
jgi:hypothetical protein